MIKDIGIAMKLASGQGLSLPIADLIQRLWKSAGQASESHSSISEMVRWVEKRLKLSSFPQTDSYSAIANPKECVS